MTGPLPLAIGCTFSDRIEALLDGRVSIDGCTARLSIVEPQKLFRQTLRERTFDVAELSMGSHIASVAAGDRHYVGLPVFLSRSFRHSNLYIRTDRRITAPADLAGKRIGLVDFQQTAALWLRGLLSDDHGVASKSITWITAGLHAPALEDRMTMELPAGLSVTRLSGTLDQLLRDGEIDALISPTAPRSFADRSVPVARLWPDFQRQEIAYWRRTTLFPIMHVLVIRRTLIEAYPGLRHAVFAAFDEARRLAVADLASRDFPKLTMPWIAHFATTARAELGDPWTYGADANAATLDTLLRYAAADGLTDRLLTVGELFS